MRKNSVRYGFVTSLLVATGGCTQAVDDVSNESPGKVALADTGPGSATGYAFVNANGTISSNSTSSWGSPPVKAEVAHVFTGIYDVIFNNEGTSVPYQAQGVAQVAAYGGDNTICKMGGAPFDGDPAPQNVWVTVICMRPDGTPVNAPFIVTYNRRSALSGIEGGYLSLKFGPTVSRVFSESDPRDSEVAKWNSTGQDIILDRYGAGDYLITFKGQNYVGGIAQVTGGSGTHPDRCEIGGWGVSNGDQVAWVVCTDTSGNYVDSSFSLSVTRGNPILTPSYSYAFADQPNATGTYIPDLTYQKGVQGGGQCQNTVTTPISITPRSTGVYDVNFPQMYSFAGQQAAASVTAAGISGEYCNIGAKGSAPNGAAYVRVRCYDRFGTPAPALFTIAYVLDVGIIC